ncbi:hypothetical protein SNEBB_009143, partial [Seison nebaliae]
MLKLIEINGKMFDDDMFHSKSSV